MKKLKILVLILFFGISLTACETKKNKDITYYMDSISLKKFEKYKTVIGALDSVWNTLEG